MQALMRRALLPITLCGRCVSAALRVSSRHVHERPFLELPPDAAQGEAYDMARDALLQLNVMVRRGIEPDALMYTSLIATMGRARLEWQAYKLFSRMLDQGVQPLPETYVALRDATSLSRRRLRSDLQQKIEESLESFPAALAEAEIARRRAEDQLCVRKFEEYMRGELPPPAPAPVTQALDPSNAHEETRAKSEATATQGGPIATVHIRNPTDAWSTARMVEEMRGGEARRVTGDTAESLRTELARLHDEELRIFLSAQRQLRHGERAELIQRIMDTVPEKSIRDMLERRRHYFRSVEFILKNDLNALHESHVEQFSHLTEDPNVLDANPSTENNHESHSIASKGNSDANVDKEKMASVPFAKAQPDRTLTSAEKDTVSPEVLYAPWGILRKPMRRAPDSPAPRDTTRMERMALSADELQLLRDKATTKDLDELPELLLRRYAFEFNLTWKRRHPLSLIEAVQWHATTFFAERIGDSLKISPTPALRRQQEDEGMHRTLENYEAFRIISQRTNNLQVVDSREINLHLKQIRREALRQERRAEETLRRERNLLSAAALAASATAFDAPPEPLEGASHVLGTSEAPEAFETPRAPRTPESFETPRAPRTSESFEASETPRTPRTSESFETPRASESFETPRASESFETPRAPESFETPRASESFETPRAPRTSESSESFETPRAPRASGAVGGGGEELPPWALFAEEEEFNLSTGRFGDPSLGRYQELSDGRFKVLPSREAQRQWVVDKQLLPGGLRDEVRRAELQRDAREEAVEGEYKRRMQFGRYRRWDALLQKAQEKRMDEKKKKGEGVAPLPVKRRLSMMLRKGKDKAPVDEGVQARYNKSL